MPTSSAELFNLALSSCGNKAVVADPAENTREAALCRLWLPICRDLVMMAAPWPATMAYARLVLDQEREDDEWVAASDPTPARRYSYDLPSNFLAPYHLQSWGHFEFVGGSISTDEESPILFYLRKVEDIDQWDRPLFISVVHYLAARIARPLTGSSTLVKENFDIALMHIEEMKALVANQNSSSMESVPDWISARGYSGTTSPRFFYPFASLSMEVSA